MSNGRDVPCGLRQQQGRRQADGRANRAKISRARPTVRVRRCIATARGLRRRDAGGRKQRRFVEMDMAERQDELHRQRKQCHGRPDPPIGSDPKHSAIHMTTATSYLNAAGSEPSRCLGRGMSHPLTCAEVVSRFTRLSCSASRQDHARASMAGGTPSSRGFSIARLRWESGGIRGRRMSTLLRHLALIVLFSAGFRAAVAQAPWLPEAVAAVPSAAPSRSPSPPAPESPALATVLPAVTVVSAGFVVITGPSPFPRRGPSRVQSPPRAPRSGRPLRPRPHRRRRHPAPPMWRQAPPSRPTWRAR